MNSRTKSGLLRASMVSYYGGDTVNELPAHSVAKSQLISVQSLRSSQDKTFVTGSKYTGDFSTLGMTGIGKYSMPHGVTYEGGFNDGNFEQMGILYYPNGAALKGFWFAGKLVWSEYYFNDSLIYHHKWRYCIMPDRRFYTEHHNELQPYDDCQITNEVPDRAVPSGCYDTGDGFYNPKTKCVTHPVTGIIIRIPTKKEEEWIIENCRKGDDENVGFRRDLYENWFDMDSSRDDYMSLLKLKLPVFENFDVTISNPRLAEKSESSTRDGTLASFPSALKMM